MNNSDTNKTNSRPTVAIILAAGKSTRMKSDVPKVMHDICGRPMLAYVLDACRQAGIEKFNIVVGFGKDTVIQAFSTEPGAEFVEQLEQKGTGHAVMMCADGLKNFQGDCVVIAGDMPMIRPETLRDLIGGHRAAGAAASIATTVLSDPAGYGRIIRDKSGAFQGITEHRDCTPEQLSINEVNPSYYCFDAATLFAALPRLKANNAKNEYYITDVLALLLADGKTVRAATSVPAVDATGINSRADLALVSKLMQQRIQHHWMDTGITIVDPDNTWIDSRARIGRDTVIRPFTCIEGSARIGERCTIGPFACITHGAVVSDGASVGPGVLNALDAVHGTRPASTSPAKRTVQVVRRPPAQSGIA